ncbi:MAG: diaminopimelate epimerase [Bacteroidales bacterium]|nr:diaminopimelate epimerase [Bacteroidales bacterium]
MTTSSQQGIDVCSRVFLDPGDIVLAKNPVYLGALQSFRAYRADVREWSPESGSLKGKVKFIYVIPDFNNPSGETMTLEERREVVRLARELDCLIVEDGPYRELRSSGEPLPTIREMAPERTLHLGSFSKIFAPGFRIGWILGPEPLLEQIYVCKQCLDLCPPVLDQYMACEFMTSGMLDANLAKTIVEYRRRRDLMVSLLEKYMPEGVCWNCPEGGLFLWLTPPEGIDTVALYDKALSAGVAYVAGSFFFTDGSHRNTMRMNFSFIDEAKMEPGIRLLASLVSSATKMYKFSGAGNNFVVLDGRKGGMEAFREAATIQALCQEHHTDGLMILTEGQGADFTMEYYNPDGSGGMMCGNGGRCIVAFADYLGIRPADGKIYHFMAPDGEHTAEMLAFPEGTGLPQKWCVRLKMIDVEGITPVKGGYFLNTGTRHFVKFVDSVDSLDMEADAKPLRWDEAFQPEGTNVNFVEVRPDGLHVRTFEKGVEGETLACGTGLTASAIAACHTGVPGVSPCLYRLQCRRGDWLQVDFQALPEGRFTNLYLSGPAELERINFVSLPGPH